MDELVDRALAPYADDLTIATKVGPGRGPSREWWSARPDQSRGQVEENLRQLGRDHLDLVTLRLMGPGPLGDHLGALADLVEAGLVRHLGVSNIRPHHLDEALAVAPVVAVQNRYGLGSTAPGADEVLRRSGELGIAFVPYVAIAGEGKESGAGATEDAAVLAIPGTGSIAHLVENVAAGDLVLKDDEVARLDAVHAVGLEREER